MARYPTDFVASCNTYLRASFLNPALAASAEVATDISFSKVTLRVMSSSMVLIDLD